MCNIEEKIENFYKNFAECKNCISKRSLRSYYDIENKISNQRKINYENKKIKY